MNHVPDTASPTRFASFEAFFPYYISEHRDPRCRWMHFIGTSGVLAIVLLAWAKAIFAFPIAIATGVWLGKSTWDLEATRSAEAVLVTIIVLAGIASPFSLWGVLWAYGFAWMGHFFIEKNRPATFTYPLWSLAGDFKMFGLMCSGELWTGRGEAYAPLPAMPD